MFKVNEIFFSLQGEGHYAGTPCVFCRFSGCNKWSGRLEDKATSPCPFCDTEFVYGLKHTEDSLVHEITSKWPGGGRPRVVFTGGEPALQLTGALIDRLRRLNFEVSIETNGSVPIPVAGPYWITVSPKDTNIKVTRGHEIKVLWPNPATPPEAFAGMEFDYFFIQPISGDATVNNTNEAIEYIKANPQWRLSAQQHKVWGIR